jgi:hypothetical protein
LAALSVALSVVL